MKKFLLSICLIPCFRTESFFIINSAFAWSLPTANPPYGDLPAP